MVVDYSFEISNLDLLKDLKEAVDFLGNSEYFL